MSKVGQDLYFDVGGTKIELYTIEESKSVVDRVLTPKDAQSLYRALERLLSSHSKGYERWHIGLPGPVRTRPVTAVTLPPLGYSVDLLTIRAMGFDNICNDMELHGLMLLKTMPSDVFEANNHIILTFGTSLGVAVFHEFSPVSLEIAHFEVSAVSSSFVATGAKLRDVLAANSFSGLDEMEYHRRVTLIKELIIYISQLFGFAKVMVHVGGGLFKTDFWAQMYELLSKETQGIGERNSTGGLQIQVQRFRE